ncbi:MAG: twin-arginine translocation signal domain-containing protein [Elainellaceae cyanobacterium]
MTRRNFLYTAGASAAGSIFISGWPCFSQAASGLRP